MPSPFCMSMRAQSEEVVLIGNPASGRGRGAAALAAAEAALRARGVQPQVCPTEAPGHAVRLAQEAAARGAGLVLVSGGDGTIRDIAAGLSGAPAAVGILPGGTGNDLCRTLGIPSDLERALDIALGARERLLDVWLWNETPFVNVAGVGLDAAVASYVNRKVRRLRGTAAYLVALAQTLPRFTPVHLELSWPGGEWRGRVWLAAFGNGCCYGGGMHITPFAAPDDGLLDIVVVEGVSWPELLRAFPGIFSGAHIRHPRVQSFRVERVSVRAVRQEATLDGELLDHTPAEVRKAEHPLRVRVPQHDP